MFTGIHKGMTPAGSKDGVLPENSLNTEFGVQHNSKPINVTFFHSQYDRLLGSDAVASGGSGAENSLMVVRVCCNRNRRFLVSGSSVLLDDFRTITSAVFTEDLSVVNLMDGVT